MAGKVIVEDAAAQVIAVVYERVPRVNLAARIKPNLDLVYAYLETHPGVRIPKAHNILFYRRDIGESDGLIGVEFGVQVLRPFDQEGPVFSTWVPPGRIATLVHVGAYARLHETHEAIRRWSRATGFALAGADWEIYGDWNEDPAKLGTKVCYLLK